MPVIQVLLDASGNILGTLTVVPASGSNPPASATLVASSGQRLTQLTIDDKTASLDPVALHAALKASIK